MFQRRPRRFRRHSKDRNHRPRGNGGERAGIGAVSLTNIRGRNNFRPQQSAERLAEKYKILAKEALTSGDKTLSESYFQHADHYMRIVNAKVLHQDQNRVQVAENLKTEVKSVAKNIGTNQDKILEPKKE